MHTQVLLPNTCGMVSFGCVAGNPKIFGYAKFIRKISFIFLGDWDLVNIIIAMTYM